VIDEFDASVTIPSLFPVAVNCHMIETEEDSLQFGEAEAWWAVEDGTSFVTVVDEVAEGPMGASGLFEAYFVRIHDTTGPAPTEVKVAGRALPLESVPGNTHQYITTEPFVVLNRQATIDDDHLIVCTTDTLGWHYNPDGQWRVWQLQIGTNAGTPTAPAYQFYAGPYWLWGSDLSYNGGNAGQEGRPNSEGAASFSLPAKVDTVRIEVWPATRTAAGAYTANTANKVFDMTHNAAHQINKGDHRFWDGRCNMGTDAAGQPNHTAQGSKFMDPDFGVCILKVTTTTAGRTEHASMEFTPKAKRLFVYDGSDRVPHTARPIDSGYASDCLAYHLAGYLATTPAGSRTAAANHGEVITSRHNAQASEATTDTVVYDYADRVSFRDVYMRLTARGQLTSIGHGATGGAGVGGVWLEGHNFHAGYALNNNPSAPIVANAPYPLPCLGVHGVRVELRHCYTAESADGVRPNSDSRVAQMHGILTNSGNGVGGGVAVGYSNYHLVHYSSRWLVRVPYRQDLHWAQNLDAVYGAINTAAAATANVGASRHEDADDDGVLDPGEDLDFDGRLISEEVHLYLYTAPIVVNQDPLVLYRRTGVKIPTGGATVNAILFNHAHRVRTALTYTGVTYGVQTFTSRGRQRRAWKLAFTGTAVAAQTHNVRYGIRLTGRGGSRYHTRYAIVRWPTEGAAIAGPAIDCRIRNMRNSILARTSLPAPPGGTADAWVQFVPRFSGGPDSNGLELQFPVVP